MPAAGTIDTPTLRTFAEAAALSAGELVHSMWSEPRQISEKGYRDLVTDADFASQEVITTSIRASFPDHGFLTEEDDPSLKEDGPVIWIIDPVDGTTNYSRQIPTYSVSIAAAVEHGVDGSGHKQYRPIVGVIYDPMRNELFSAAEGGPSTLNGRSIAVSKVDEMGGAIISMDWSRSYKQRQALLTLLGAVAHQVHTIRATGSACLSLAWIAAGRVDVYFNFGISPWDVAAAAVIIIQAGGVITNSAGEPWTLGDSVCVASNGLIHATFLAQAGITAGI